MLKFTTTRSNTGRFIDKIDIPIACPHCGNETKESLARLQHDPTLTCLSCSKDFKVESGGSARKAADEVNNLDRALDNLFK